jgi:hypothetical protein
VNAIERVISAESTPDWWDRMWDSHLYGNWCDAHAPETPQGFDHAWGCYRLRGHTGRHLGLVSVAGDGSHDAWVVWS